MHHWLRAGANRLAGRLPGIGLSTEGREEAERVAAHLAGMPLAWIVASPLERTVQTAEIIARRHDLPVERDERFIESGLGPWEGRWVADLIVSHSAQWRAWREDPTALHLPGMEPVEAIADRMGAALGDWLGRGGHGVIVSHQDPIAALLCRIVGMDLSRMRAWDIRTGSLTVVRRTSYGLVVEAVNSGVPLTQVRAGMHAQGVRHRGSDE